MLRTFLRAGLAITLGLTGLSTAVAQTTPPVPPASQPPPQPGSAAAVPQAHRAKAILGTAVRIQGDTQIGTVDDIVFDDAGMIEYLIVAKDNKLVTVPWEAAKFNFANRTATVNITPEQYQRIPTYTITTYPAYFTPAYRTEIYRFYGLTPGQERRLERRLERRP